MGPGQLGVISAKAVAGAWTPLALTPLIWYDSTANMDPSSMFWNDTMGHYNMAASGPTKPTYSATALNGRPGFIFDGTNDVIAAPRVTEIENIANLTIWMVGKRATLSYDDAGSTNVTTIYHYSDDNIYSIFTGLKYLGTTGGVGNAFHYTIMLYDGTQSTDALKLIEWVDGVQKTLSGSGPIPTTTATDSSMVLKIGNFYSNTYLAGTAVEFGVIARTITSGERASLNTYLAAKYAL